MTEAGAPEPDPSAIGVIPKPPFVRLPDPAALFAAPRRALPHARRAATTWRPTSRFLAGLADAQAPRIDGRAAPELPGRRRRSTRAARHAMPPLDRAGFAAGRACRRCSTGCCAARRGLDMPPAGARRARPRRRAPATPSGPRWSRTCSPTPSRSRRSPSTRCVAAALQVHFARLAARLDAGGAEAGRRRRLPGLRRRRRSASLVVGWTRRRGRALLLLLALRHALELRPRQVHALRLDRGRSRFREIAGGDGTVKAEVCGACRGYVKVLYQQKDPELDPVADDVASARPRPAGPRARLPPRRASTRS